MYSSFYLLLLSFSIWSALVVYSQETFPFVSFTEQTLVNHDYVDLNEVGRSDTGGNDVRCITDLNTCCSASQGVHRGNWYFPNGTRLLLLIYQDLDVFEARGPMSVDLRLNSGTSPPTGIYRCDIPTRAVNDVSGDPSVAETIFVGLFNSTTGGI